MSEHTILKMTDMNYGPDRPAAENPVKIMDLTLRDGHQSPVRHSGPHRGYDPGGGE